MDHRDKTALAELLGQQRIATLAVDIEGMPYASLVPFATGDRSQTLLIHVSELARHSAGLTDGAAFSALIHQPDCRPETNPAQLARVTLQGRVERLRPDTAEHKVARERYLTKFPKSAMTFELGDFSLITLRIESCRFVAGFGKAFDVAPTDLAELD